MFVRLMSLGLPQVSLYVPAHPSRGPRSAVAMNSDSANDVFSISDSVLTEKLQFVEEVRVCDVSEERTQGLKCPT
jgi:hypothetical protein